MDKLLHLAPYLLCWFMFASSLTKPSSAGEDEKAEGNLLANCSYITFVKTAGPNRSVKFSSFLRANVVGFSVELFFSGPVSNMEANGTTLHALIVTEISKTHWIISNAKITKMKKPKAEFTANYIADDEVQLFGIILNGEKLLCGSGTTKVFTSKTEIYDGMKECKVGVKRYENESIITVKENFYSKRIGLAVDIIFASDFDNVEKTSLFTMDVYNKRYITLINSGYVTSEDKPVEITFNVEHVSRPAPEIAAIIMNDVVVCGFSPFYEVFHSRVLHTISSLLDDGDAFFQLVNPLILSSNIISICALVVAIVAGIFAWKVIGRQVRADTEEEPMYATPNKRKEVQDRHGDERVL